MMICNAKLPTTGAPVIKLGADGAIGWISEDFGLGAASADM